MRGVADCRRRREQRLDLGGQATRRHSGLRLHLDRVELPDLLEEPLRGRLVEDGERDAAQRDVGGVLRDPRDPEMLDGAVNLDADPIADGDVLLVGSGLVDDHLV